MYRTWILPLSASLIFGCAPSLHAVSYDEHRGEPLARPVPPQAFQVRSGAYAMRNNKHPLPGAFGLGDQQASGVAEGRAALQTAQSGLTCRPVWSTAGGPGWQVPSPGEGELVDCE